MKVLVHLEPMPFRGEATFVIGHFQALVEPIIRALVVISKSKPISLGISSNILLCLSSLDMLRSLSRDSVIYPNFFPVHSGHFLPDYKDSVAKYSRDLYKKDRPRDAEKWPRYFNELFNVFRPDVVITTSDNRYLMRECKLNYIPLLSSEFGPLPRSLYPQTRFLNVGGHLNTDILSSVRRIRNQLHKLGSVAYDIDTNFSRFLSAYHEQQKINPSWEIATAYFSQFKNKTIALLSLQPAEWITWEGALGTSLNPSEVLQRALSRMESDILVVVFHADRRGDIPPQLFSEIWLSDSRLEKLPEQLAHNTSEMLLPFVDEFMSVSSNTALTAFFLDKKITAISSSWVTVLSRLQTKYVSDIGTIDGWRARIFTLFSEKYSVAPSIFSSPADLADLIINRLKDCGFQYSAVARQLPIPVVHPTHEGYTPQSLSQIHNAINIDINNGQSIQALFIRYGRNALGYLLEPGSIGAELGVAEGHFSESLLLSDNFSTLYSIDRWLDHHDENEYERAVERLSKFESRSRILRKTFNAALADLPDKSLDFIYIDAYAHKGDTAEIFKLWKRKLKIGSLVSGHDYCQRMWPSNYDSINDLTSYTDRGGIMSVNGVISDNNEDVIPSFYFFFCEDK
ncbi:MULTISPECIES: class I SAM-dependent methyltransferase [Cyanobium]|nr:MULTISPECIES: class I SAM-dependent methyltransferase [Cyanobium]